ncbi:hypothetical protein NUU61_001599 [Penicillium alfredii]|uniref:Reverse transcriptase domain-containing protein n=1 Tax=Penicillium alfredii TaxID=1506179 RepID=A0A9W9KLZ4_9EURO|nr:uncharacterized protein NUU61_001599 [Penicillium alfredii]KAJ5110342.1 hypothetical protein NUU61_001599 [Penicillium alfredii]
MGESESVEHRPPLLNQSPNRHSAQKAMCDGRREAEDKYRHAKNGIFGNRRTPHTPAQEQQTAALGRRQWMVRWPEREKGKGQAIDYTKGLKDSLHAANLAQDHTPAELAPPPQPATEHFDLLSITHPDIAQVSTFVGRSLVKLPVHYTQHVLLTYISDRVHGFFIHNIYYPPAVIENYGIGDLRKTIQRADSVPRQNHHIAVGGLIHTMASGLRSFETTLDLNLLSWELPEKLWHVRVVEISGLPDHLLIESEFKTALTTLTTGQATPKQKWKELDVENLRTTLSLQLTSFPLVNKPQKPPIQCTLSPGIDQRASFAAKGSPPGPKRDSSVPGSALPARTGTNIAGIPPQESGDPQAHQALEEPDRSETSRGGQGTAVPIRHSRHPQRPGPRTSLSPITESRTTYPCLLLGPPTASLVDIEGFTYPEPWPVPPITATKVWRAIYRPGAFKVGGPDDILNGIMQAAPAAPSDQHTPNRLFPVLEDLYNNCLGVGYCPQHFREAKTVALTKPGKDDNKPKRYRPIVLFYTIGKVLAEVLALQLRYLAEKHDLLPHEHFGSRKGQGTKTALYAALESLAVGRR